MKKQYKILDTNILLLDANNLLLLGKDAIIVLPETVLDELDSKKSLMNELGFQARSFGRLLTKATVEDIKRNAHMTISVLSLEGVTIWVVALAKYDALEGTSYTNDRKILEAALSVNTYPEVQGCDVSFVSVDVMARLRGMSLGLTVDAFQEVKDLDFDFTRYIEVPNDKFHTVHNSKVQDIIPDHTIGTYNYHLENPETGQVKLCTIENDLIKVIGPETEKELRRQEINPCNAQQLFMSKAIQDPLVDIVVVEAKAGSGKTAVSISNSIRLVKQGKYNSIVYIRNSINDEDPNEAVGFLSGNEEKFAVYLHPLEDTLEFIVRDKVKESKLKGLELEEKVQEGINKLKAECNIQASTAEFAERLFSKDLKL